MFGQRIGKIDRPLENMLVEELEQHGKKHIYMTIVMDRLPQTAPISRSVAEVCKDSEKVGELYIDDFATLRHPVERKDVLSFSLGVPLISYLNTVGEIPTGKIEGFQPWAFNCPLMGFAANRDGLQGMKPINLYYVLVTNEIIEYTFAIGKYKKNHPSAKQTEPQGVMGYKIVGIQEEAYPFRDNVIEIVSQQPKPSAVLTLSQVAFMKEALSEVEYHTNMVLLER